MQTCGFFANFVMMNYLDSLNTKQLEAVQTTEGPVRVLAGAGSGKTRALTARYCYLADLLGVDPGAILCLTFTNKAAAEMKQRIRRLLGDFDLAHICTFHSFCVRMLKEDIHVMNYPANFVLMDEEDRTDMLQRIYTDMGITLKELPVKRSVDYIGRRKAAGDYLDILMELDNSRMQKRLEECGDDVLAAIYTRYLYEQKKNYAVDFDDVIIFAHHILGTVPHILRKWQDRMQYVMVDEFQDVSPRQYAIARMIAGVHRNIFIVGDPDQTIYSWRGADVKLFLNFDKVYPDARTVVLNENYRSTPQILAPSNALIAKNTERYPKELFTRCKDGRKPAYFHARNEQEEARWVADTVRSLLKEGVDGGDICILYRAHHLSRPVEDALIKQEIPYKIFSGTAFYARREVKDVLAYMRMLVTADDMAFIRTVNTPSRKIGRQKMAALRRYADEEGCRLYDALTALCTTPEFARTGARKYLKIIEEARELVGTMSLGDLMQRVMDMSGYEEMLRGLSEWERLDNLAELKRAIDESGRDDDASLENFLARAALIANIDRDSNDSQTVKLMTVHSAKGMEFPAVFVYGLSEGAFPSRRSSGPEEIEEERRLAYVALTRARRLLFLSDSDGFGHDKNAKATSRFVYEMGAHNLDILTTLAPQAPQPEPMAGARDAAAFDAGDDVEHPVFGHGKILEVNAAKQNYTIKFDNIPTARTMRFGAPLDPAK